MQNNIWEICDNNSKQIKTPPTQINHLLLIKHVQIISPNYIFFKIKACKPIFNSTKGLGTNNRWIVVIPTIQEIFIPRNCIFAIEKSWVVHVAAHLSFHMWSGIHVSIFYVLITPGNSKWIRCWRGLTKKKIVFAVTELDNYL